MSSNPLLFMKVGGIGSAPNGFYPELAQTFQAVVHDTAQTLQDLGLENYRGKDRAWRVRRETQGRALTSLIAGQNTFYDGYLNRKEYRDRLTGLALRERPDTIIVLLALKETTRKDRTARIIAKNGCMGAEELPPRVENDLVRSRKMHQHIEWPGPDENPLNLDGRQSTPVLLDRISLHIETLIPSLQQ